MPATVKKSFSTYDTDSMHGLPLGIQVAGRRLEEEKVSEGMKVIEAALAAPGHVFIPKVNVKKIL